MTRPNLTREALAEFIYGALMASDTPIENFLDSDPPLYSGPLQLADDLLEYLEPWLSR